MLGAFVRNGLTQRECETEALFQIIAGSDTTAGAIRMTLLYIMTTPRVHARLRAEVDAKFADMPDDQIVPNAVAETLPYLQAVVLEGLRIHPPFVGLPFKEVPPQGDTLEDGRFVPGGTRIAPSIWALTRRQDVFGEDTDVFRPERWIVADDDSEAQERVQTMRRTVDLIFGYGRWACAGKVLAFLEINKTLVEMMRRFELQLVYPLKPVTTVNHNLFLQKNMWMQVSERVKGGTTKETKA